MVKRIPGFDGSSYPQDVYNFLDQFNDERLAAMLSNFTPGIRAPCFKSSYHSHHIDYELDAHDSKFHRLSVAPNSSGTKQPLSSGIGQTPYVCEIRVSAELFQNGLPDDFSAIARKALLESMVSVSESEACAILVDGTVCRATDEDIATHMERIAEKKEKPTRAPNGKLYWDFAAWGPPSLPEHYAEYECTKPDQKRKKR